MQAIASSRAGVQVNTLRRISSPSLSQPAVRAVQLQERRGVAARAQTEQVDVNTEKLVADLKEKFDKIENKGQVALYTGGAVFALFLTNTVLGAINNVPLLPKMLELVGLTYSSWFIYRYVLFKAGREELIKDVEELKSKITGN